MRTAPALSRTLFGAMLALLLGLRLLSPAGFMPSFEHGAVTIVACPDAGAALAAGMHHHAPGDRKTSHQPCPYAAASALGTAAADASPVAPPEPYAAVRSIGGRFLFVERHGSRERPPLRGPPIPA
jgi:hypothetical protein